MSRSSCRLATASSASMTVAARWSVGCAVGPDYKRPELPPPPASWAGHAGGGDAGRHALVQVFDDEALQALIRDALAHNLDLRLAWRGSRSPARCPASPSRSCIRRSTARPVHRQPGLENSQPPGALQDVDRTFNNTSLGASSLWEIDLFGRLRRNNEAAFDRYLATKKAIAAVIVAVVSDVATSYFLLRELDLQLEIARQTLVINDETVTYYTKRLRAACRTSWSWIRPGATARSRRPRFPDIERQIAIVEHAISVLAGRPPGAIAGAGRWMSSTSRPSSCRRAGGAAREAAGCAGSRAVARRPRTPTSAPPRRSSTRPSA